MRIGGNDELFQRIKQYFHHTVKPDGTQRKKQIRWFHKNLRTQLFEKQKKNRAPVITKNKFEDAKRIEICAKAAYIFLQSSLTLLDNVSSNERPAITHSVQKNSKNDAFVSTPRKKKKVTKRKHQSSAAKRKASKRQKNKSEVSEVKNLAEANVSLVKIVRPEIHETPKVAKESQHAILQWLVNMEAYGKISSQKLVDMLDDFMEIQEELHGI